MNTAIIQLAIGECLEVDGLAAAMRMRLSRLKKRMGWSRRFSVRQWDAYFVRIWRVE